MVCCCLFLFFFRLAGQKKEWSTEAHLRHTLKTRCTIFGAPACARVIVDRFAVFSFDCERFRQPLGGCCFALSSLLLVDKQGGD